MKEWLLFSDMSNQANIRILEYCVNYRVYSNRAQAKRKISNPVCTQLESKQFQEVNFLSVNWMLHCNRTIAKLCMMTNSGYGLCPTCYMCPWLRSSRGQLEKGPLTAMVNDATESQLQPRGPAAGLGAVPTKVSPKCQYPFMNDERHS